MAGEERVFAIENNRTDSALDGIGIKLDAAVFEEAGQSIPVVQAVSDLVGDRRLGGDAGKLKLEPAPEPLHQWLAFVLAYRATLVGAHAADRLLDGIELADAFERLARDRGIAALGDVEELAAQMCPAEGE